MAIENMLFTELFRARSLNNLVLCDRVRNALAGGAAAQHLLLYGPQGTSKTTICKILSEGHDVLKLNGSSENGIDVIREQVVNFASTMSLTGSSESKKIIFIDEADGLTSQAWDALRETIEHYATSVRYLCTCNRIEKIPMPIRSRFLCVPVYPINKEEEVMVFEGYCNYVKDILKYINISYTDESVKTLVNVSFPDMRTILNTIQNLYIQHASELDVNSIAKTFDTGDLFNLIVNGGDPIENYKFIVSNYGSVPDEALMEISRSFIDYISLTYPQYGQCIPYLITTAAEYVAQLPTAPDRLLVLLACVFKMQLIIKEESCK